MVAESKQDASLCEKIQDPYEKERCMEKSS